MSTGQYWARLWQRRLSRRALLRAGASGGVAVSTAVAFGCGGEEERVTPATPTAASTGTDTGTPSGEFANAKRGGVFNLDTQEEPPDLRPYVTEQPAATRALQYSYNHLLYNWEQAEDPDKFGLLFVAPELAADWELVDATTYRFNLVQNAKWHNLPPVNGRQLTSADIKYSFERMIDPSLLESRTRSSLEAIDRIETPDNFTAVFKMKFPFAPFLTNAAHSWAVIVPRELAETEDIKQRAVGTRFIFKEWQRGVQMVWERNPDYFRTGRPFIDKVVMRMVPDLAAILANFRSGETDTWSGAPPTVPVEQFDEVARSLGDQVVKLEYRTSNNIISKIAFDTTNEPFKDQRLRHAFLYGIPYDSVIKLFAGYATRTGPLPPGNQMWALPVEDLPATDMERAKALLSEAGYGPDNMLKVKSVVSLYGGPQFSQIVQSLVKPLGIEITIETMESGEWVSKIYSGKQPYHLTAHFDATFDDPDRRLYSYYHSKGAQNQTHYSNPEVDRLLEAQRREFDAEKRRDLVRQVQRLIVNDAPEVFVVSNGGRLLRRTWVNNWHLMLYYLNTDRQLDSIWYDPMPSGRAG